jgi:hypothetical protein
MGEGCLQAASMRTGNNSDITARCPEVQDVQRVTLIAVKQWGLSSYLFYILTTKTITGRYWGTRHTMVLSQRVKGGLS